MKDTIVDLCEQVEEFSLFKQEKDSELELKDYLLKLASRLRGSGKTYQIEYLRPDRPVFRLRSTKELEQQALEKTISFLEPGRRLNIVIEELDTEIFEGICAELTILGEFDDLEEEVAREPELNLLMPRTFQAELYAEYQRCERYGSDFLIGHVRLDENLDWKPAAREFKHLGKVRDMVGLIPSDQIIGFFPARSEDDPIREQLESRINAHYSEDEARLKFLYVPGDVQDWNELQHNLFDVEIDQESDLVGNNDH